MKILFVTAVLPYPLHSGGQIRIYQLLKYLSKKHDITLVSFIRDEKEREFVRHLSFCASVHTVMRGRAWQLGYIAKSIFGKYSFLLSTYDNNRMRSKIVELQSKTQFDVLHIEPFYVWPSVPKNEIPIVVSEHNIEYDVYGQYVRQFWLSFLRPFLWLDVLKLTYWEQYVWRLASSVIAVSSDDADTIKKVIKKQSTVVPNGVDLDQFSYRKKRLSHAQPHILFVGDFRWFPNVDAMRRLVRDIWPEILKIYPKAQLRIVGRHMSDKQKIFMKERRVDVAENVEDISVEYKQADIFVAPLAIAGGTKFKILEAMASGLPVVTTIAGAAGLKLQAGYHVLIAEKTSDFVDSICALWINTSIYAAQAKAARLHIEKYYSWPAIADTLDSVWRTYEKP